MHWNKKAHVSDRYVCQIIFGLQQLHTFAQVNNSSDAIKIDRKMIFIERKENSVTKAFLHLAAFLLYLKCITHTYQLMFYSLTVRGKCN